MFIAKCEVITWNQTQDIVSWLHRMLIAQWPIHTAHNTLHSNYNISFQMLINNNKFGLVSFVLEVCLDVSIS